MKKLLECFHGGYFWLGTKISIMVDLISQIISLPKAGVDSSKYFQGKDNDKNIVAKLWKRAGVINTMNDKAFRIAVNFLMINIVGKNHPNHYSSRVITSAEQCIASVHMNWSMFPLNKFMEDVVLIQEVGKTFTYSWLLILIALVGWMEPTSYVLSRNEG